MNIRAVSRQKRPTTRTTLNQDIKIPIFLHITVIKVQIQTKVKVNKLQINPNRTH